MTIGTRCSTVLGATILACAFALGLRPYGAFAGQPDTGAQSSTPQRRTLAQKIVSEAAAKHRELASLELSATPAGKQVCETVASTEPRDLGEKCDDDEFFAMKTGKPSVDKETDEWDVTISLHDASARLIGALGMDFKAEAGQQQSAIVRMAEGIAREIEKQIPSSDALFAPEP